MKKYFNVAILAAAVTLVACCIARAQGGFGGPMPGGPGGLGGHMGMHFLLHNDQLTSEIGLSDAQVEQLRNIHSQSMKDAIKMKADVDILQIDLMDELAADKPNMSKVDSIIDQIGAKQTQMQKGMIHCAMDSKNVLTEDQQEKLDELMKKRFRERGPERDGKRDGNKESGHDKDRGPGARGMAPDTEGSNNGMDSGMSMAPPMAAPGMGGPYMDIAPGMMFAPEPGED